MRQVGRSVVAATILLLLRGPLARSQQTPPELEEVKGFIKTWSLGCRIRVPKGAQAEKNDFGHTYHLPINRTFACNGPATHFAVLVDMCASLKVVK